MLNRRAFITAGVASLSGLLAACRGVGAPATARPTPTSSLPTRVVQASPTPTTTPFPTPTPAPVTVRLWVDPNVSPHFSSAAADAIAALDGISSDRPIALTSVDDPAQADVRISVVDGATAVRPTAMVWARAPLALVTSARVPLTSVTADQARGLLAGTLTDWSAAASPTSIPVYPVTLAGSAAGARRQAANLDDFAALSAAHPGAVALVVPADVDFRVSVVAVDGVDPLRSTDVPSSYPFHLDMVVDMAPSAPQLVGKALWGAVATPQTAGVPGTTVSVTMVGDVILGRTVHTIMTRLHDFAAPFRMVADELKQADLTIADLECSLSDNITPPSDPYTFSFMTYTAGVQGLQLAGIDGVSQANNHSMNFGEQGMNDTLAALKTAGIRVFGIGPDVATARQPLMLEAKGLRFAWLGFDGITGDSYGATGTSAGTSPLVLDNLVADVAAAARSADVVIPVIHWGVEYTLVPTNEQRTIARRAIDAGATMVVGSHPHWVQGMEVYQGRPILYSLANFVFDQDWSLETKQGLILHLLFSDARLSAIRFVPVIIEDFYQPRIVSGADMVTILDRVWSSTDTLSANPV